MGPTRVRKVGCDMNRILAILAIASVTTAVAIAQRRGGGATADGLAFRFVGPAVGNRVASIAGVAGDPFTYYARAASRGVWKTTHGGVRWTPGSDALAGTAIRARAGAPAQPSVVC